MPSKEFATKGLLPSPETTTSTAPNNNNIARPSMLDMVPREVDELVNEIKLNLRLKSNCSAMEASSKSKPSVQVDIGSANNMLTKYMRSNGCYANNNNSASSAAGSSLMFRTKIRSSTRIAPYFVPAKSGADSGGCYSCGSPRCFRTCLRQPRTNSSDPYQLLQELLKEGGLIKEAVRRISTKPSENPIDVKYYDYDQDEYESTSAAAGIHVIGLEA